MSNKTVDVVALGELLIDFTMNGQSNQGNPIFEANPGGAPCNVLAILNKLGKKVSFIGKVGKDNFGKQLKDTLDEVGIDSSHLVMDETVMTTLAIVHTAPDGDRSFSFYRKPGADMMLTADEVDETVLDSAKIFHYGTLSMTHPGVEAATRKAVEYAGANGILRSFDPNLRPPLWDSLEVAKEKITYGLEHCDILKISDNELEFMTGCADLEKAARILVEKYPIKLVNVTLGKDGSRSYYKGKEVFVPGRVVEKVVDTTGAGDTFCGSVLNYVLEHGIDELNEENLKEMLTFANTAASLITKKKGAIRSMPTKEDIEQEL
ncbi:Fructokinase [Lachnospiraceae bacterium TWA4]|nr:Fructokinase [Lachnospiraceae bacterium TWA4]